MHKEKSPYHVLLITFSIVLLQMFSCAKGNEPKPRLSIQDVSQSRTKSESIMKFKLVLDKPAVKEVSVSYSLLERTAKSPADFVSTNGTILIPANQNEATIDVRIPGDPQDDRQPNLNFTVEISDPKNCTITTSSAKGTIITENGTNLSTDNKGYSTPVTYPGYSLVWSDEFSGSTLDTHIWNQELGNGSGGWGNNELEYYTNSPRNTFLSNGNLIIEARKETSGSFNYTSGRMTTLDNKAFKFGRIDIRAKLPVGKGIWPALWMLGTNISSAGWPACGEIDIMELIGIKPSTVYGTLHWANASGAHASKGSNYVLTSGDYSKEFHVFSLVWKENNLQWYVDDHKILEVSVSDVVASNYPFNASQFLIFNVAVGGNWPGPPDTSTEFPERMFVDYIRVFQ